MAAAEAAAQEAVQAVAQEAALEAAAVAALLEMDFQGHWEDRANAPKPEDMLDVICNPQSQRAQSTSSSFTNLAHTAQPVPLKVKILTKQSSKNLFTMRQLAKAAQKHDTSLQNAEQQSIAGSREDPPVCACSAIEERSTTGILSTPATGYTAPTPNRQKLQSATLEGQRRLFGQRPVDAAEGLSATGVRHPAIAGQLPSSMNRTGTEELTHCLSSSGACSSPRDLRADAVPLARHAGSAAFVLSGRERTGESGAARGVAAMAIRGSKRLFVTQEDSVVFAIDSWCARAPPRATVLPCRTMRSNASRRP
eukprot:5329924-Pleurochrysis_carterae.AAC.2